MAVNVVMYVKSHALVLGVHNEVDVFTMTSTTTGTQYNNSSNLRV